MIRRAIPSTGETLPVVGLGTWQTFDVGAADHPSRAEVLERFVARGGQLVDSSPMYGRAEAVVGQLTADLGLANLFIATKVWTRGERAGIAQMEESFAKLRVKRVDLMQVHNLVDVDTHLRTLARWKAEGRVRYIGVTHYLSSAHRDLERFLARDEIDVVQVNYSVGERQAESRLLPMAADRGIAIIVNRPFANRDLFARVAGIPVPAVGVGLGCGSWAQLFLKYVLAHPAVTVVIPATADVRHLDENMAAAEGRLPDEAERAEIVRVWDSLS